MSPEMRERRSFPRPPLWLNLALLILAAATFAYAKHQRDVLDAKMAILFKPTPASSPAELTRIREELSEMDLTRAQLAHELDARLQYAQSRNSEQFYISVDSAKHKFYFRFGNDVVREADAVIGERKTIKARDGRTWTFVPVKGAFTVAAKETDYVWNPPQWLLVMNHETNPHAVRNGLGKYVIVLQDNYIIHSPPPDDSPLHGMAKPGSIMVPEADLAAIWPRIEKGTRVYIF
jgi:hypothetical protein